MSLLKLFRFLFPSWEFFDQFGQVPFLYLRIGSDADFDSAWQKVPEEKKRKISQLFLASRVNYHHFMSTLLHELVRDFLVEGKIEEFNASVGKKIIQNLIDSRIIEFKQTSHLNKNLFYQYKISSQGPDKFDFYVSSICKWSEV